MGIGWHNFRRRRGAFHLTIQRSCENLKKSREFLLRLLNIDASGMFGAVNFGGGVDGGAGGQG